MQTQSGVNYTLDEQARIDALLAKMDRLEAKVREARDNNQPLRLLLFSAALRATVLDLDAALDKTQ